MENNCSKKDWHTEEDIIKDLGKMKVQDWSKMAMDRDAWRRIVEQQICSAKRRKLLHHSLPLNWIWSAELVGSISHAHTLYIFKIHFNTVLLLMSRFLK